jgi:hypothetical protein
MLPGPKAASSNLMRCSASSRSAFFIGTFLSASFPEAGCYCPSTLVYHNTESVSIISENIFSEKEKIFSIKGLTRVSLIVS